MDFGAIISRAVRITWDHKVLWILGFLAALGSGGAGNVAQSPQATFNFSDGDAPPWMRVLARDPSAILAGAALFGCLIFILSIVLFVVGIIARGGLIAGVQQVESEGNTSFGRAWSVGAARFWRMLGLNILVALPLIVLIIVILVAFGGTIVAAIASQAAAGRDADNAGALVSLIGGSIVVLCCVMCVAILYGLVAQALTTFGERAIVLDNTGVTAGISRGWATFRANLGNIILLALLMWVIAIAFGLVTGAIIAVILVPTLLPVITEIGQGGVLGAGTTVLAISGVIVASIVGAIINTLFVTFNSTAWTLAYRQFTGAAPAITTAPAQPPLPAA